jgi:hypothetical protein
VAGPGIDAEVSVRSRVTEDIVPAELPVVQADPADQVWTNLGLFGRLELVDGVRSALDQPEVGIVAEKATVVKAESLIHAVNLNTDRKVVGDEGHGRKPMPAGIGRIPEVAQWQAEAAADREFRSALGHHRRRSRQCHKSRANHRTPHHAHDSISWFPWFDMVLLRSCVATGS